MHFILGHYSMGGPFHPQIKGYWAGHAQPLRPRGFRFGWLLLLGCLLGTWWGLAPRAVMAGAPAGVETHSAAFLAYRPGEEAPVYSGEHRITRKGDLITDYQVYRTPTGKTVMEVESVFDQATGKPLTFSSLDLRSGRTEKVWRENNELRFEVRLTKDSNLEVGTQPYEPSLFLWPNLMYVVSRHWTRLSRGESFAFNLFVPSHKAEYALLLKKVADTTPGQTRMEMVPASSLLKLILNPVTLVFDTAHPDRLLEYSGRSAVRNDAGHTEELRIVMRPT